MSKHGLIYYLLAISFTLGVFATFAQADTARKSPPGVEVLFPGFGIGANFNRPEQAGMEEAGWTVSRGKANRFDRLYHPGDPVRLSVDLRNSTDTAEAIAGRWRWAWVGDVEADRRGVRYVAQGEHATSPARYDLGPGGTATETFAFEAPDRFGVLALFFESGQAEDRVTRWVTNVAVIPALAEGPRPDSMFFGDTRGVRDWQRLLELPVMARMGVKWVRVGESWGRIEPRRGVYRWDRLDGEAQALRDHGLLGLYLGGIGADWTRAYGRLSWPRDNPNKFSGSPDPSHYGDWARLFEELAKRHKDVIYSFNVFNEPWEAGGISNWGGTGAHYRNLQRMAHLGAMRGNPDALVGGNDSDSNIHDNLRVDPQWRQYTNLLTVHGGEFPGQFIHRMVPDLPVWNTEHWYTASSDRTIQDQLFQLLAGREKTNTVILGNFFTAGYRAGGYYNPKDRDNVPDLIPQPNAASYAVMAAMLEDMELVEELSPSTLPYKLLFSARANAPGKPRHPAVLALIGTAIDPEVQPWWQVEPDPQGVMRLAPASGIGVFDRYGNPIAPGADGGYDLPFNAQIVYLTAEDTETLRAAADRLTVVKAEHPLQLGFLDPTDAGLSVATLRVANPLPNKQTVKIKVEAGPGIEVGLKHETLKLAGGERVDVAVTLDGTLPDAGLPLRVTAVSSVGRAEHTETLNLRSITRLTPTLDTDPADWLEAGARPLRLRRGADPIPDSLAAAMPWERLAAEGSEKAAGRFALGYDDQHLYVYAELFTPKRGGLPWDQTREDWFVLHPGGHAYEQAPQWPFTGESLQLAIDAFDNPDDGIYPDDDARQRRFPQFRTDYLLTFYETRQGGMQAWMMKRPGGHFRHRYPFSPQGTVRQDVIPGARVVVKRDDATSITRFEAAVPWSSLGGIEHGPGQTLNADIKLTTNRWSGLYSATGRGVAKHDRSVFQPYWATGYTLDLPWRFAE